jgi:hypothetical protein
LDGKICHPIQTAFWFAVRTNSYCIVIA